MSWCPKCKMEYRDGITVCADCSSTLVEELEAQCDQCIALFDSEEEANKFLEFLTYSDIADVSILYDEIQEGYGVYVTEEKLSQARKLYLAYDITEEKKKREAKKLQEEENPFEEALKEAFEETDLDEGEAANRDVEIPLAKVMPKSSVTYVKKEERYNDFKSSFYIFLVFGIFGIIFTVLNAVGVVSLFSYWLQFLILGGVSIAFIVVAIISYRKSKILFDEIDDEKEITSSIKEWLSENITKETLSQFDNDVDAKEVIFLKKIDYIKKCLTDRYTFDSDSYVDELIEEFYNENFE